MAASQHNHLILIIKHGGGELMDWDPCSHWVDYEQLFRPKDFRVKYEMSWGLDQTGYNKTTSWCSPFTVSKLFTALIHHFLKFLMTSF